MHKKEKLPFLLTGFFGIVFGMGFYIKSLTMIPIATVVLLIQIYPVFTAIIARFILKENVGKMGVVSLVLTVFGVWTIFGTSINMDSTQTFGAILALAAGIGYSGFIVSMRYFENKGHDFWDVVFWPMIIGSVILFGFSFAFEDVVFVLTADVALFILGIISIPTLAAYVFYAKGLKTIRANIAPIIETMFEPFFAIVIAFIVFGTEVPKHIYVGGALIIIANILIEVQNRKKPRKRIK